jgi:hypothetical protein
MGTSLYCRPTDFPTVTWDLSAGAANALYPVANLGLLQPFKPKPFKATSGTATPRATAAGAITLEAIAIIGHNLGGVSIGIQNGAGLSTSVTPQAAKVNGLWVNAYKDLRGLANRTSTTWTFPIAGAPANIAINKILLITTVRALNIRWGPTSGVRYPIDRLLTQMEVALDYELGVSGRPFRADMKNESDRIAMLTLADAAWGKSRVWWLVPDTDVNDCLLARFTDDTFLAKRDARAVSQMVVNVEEFGLGPAL